MMHGTPYGNMNGMQYQNQMFGNSMPIVFTPRTMNAKLFIKKLDSTTNETEKLVDLTMFPCTISRFVSFKIVIVTK